MCGDLTFSNDPVNHQPKRAFAVKFALSEVAQNTAARMTVTNSIIAREPVQDQTLNWSLEDVEFQAPGDDEVLVEMRASGICHTDIVMSSVPDGVMGIKYPRIVGHEGIDALKHKRMA